VDPVVVIVQPGRQALYLLLRDPIVLGRECEGLVLADAQVSRRHLELRPLEGAVRCTDLGSTNGTFLDGVRLTAPADLRAGATATLGETQVRVVDVTGPGAAGGGVGRRTTIVTGRGAGAGDDAADLRRTSIDLVADLVTADEWRPQVDAGTVTILFSDIESSTERVSRIGDEAWFDLLELHNRVFREELAVVGGREIKSQGDGFMLTFPSVRRALGFAVAVQRRLAEHERRDPDRAVRVRIGLHTGEVITDASGDLFGRHVNKAARVANLAAGGQILVSGTVREIASGDRDVEFGDGVEVELKGLDGTHVVHELFWRDQP
jgi:class 3 adenylate cyclase